MPRRACDPPVRRPDAHRARAGATLARYPRPL